jgi:hypothetical protein
MLHFGQLELKFGYLTSAIFQLSEDRDNAFSEAGDRVDNILLLPVLS